MTIECTRSGRKLTKTFPDGRTVSGYLVSAHEVDEAGEPAGPKRVVGIAAQTEGWLGWYIVDAETGETIFGLGESTRTGYQLHSCLWSFARKLEKEQGS